MALTVYYEGAKYSSMTFSVEVKILLITKKLQHLCEYFRMNL